VHFLIFRMTSAGWFGRSPDEFEFQMLYGSRPEEQTRLAGEGHRFRTYLPYDSDCYGYLMRRLAERASNVVFFARALILSGSRLA
jgi:proline dehydrogenase